MSHINRTVSFTIKTAFSMQIQHSKYCNIKWLCQERGGGEREHCWARTWPLNLEVANYTSSSINLKTIEVVNLKTLFDNRMSFLSEITDILSNQVWATIASVQRDCQASWKPGRGRWNIRLDQAWPGYGETIVSWKVWFCWFLVLYNCNVIPMLYLEMQMFDSYYHQGGGADWGVSKSAPQHLQLHTLFSRLPAEADSGNSVLLPHNQDTPVSKLTS